MRTYNLEAPFIWTGEAGRDKRLHIAHASTGRRALCASTYELSPRKVRKGEPICANCLDIIRRMNAISEQP